MIVLLQNRNVYISALLPQSHGCGKIYYSGILMNSPKGILVTGITVITGCLGLLFSLLISQMTEGIQEIPRIEEYEQKEESKTSGSRKVKRKRGRPSRKE